VQSTEPATRDGLLFSGFAFLVLGAVSLAGLLKHQNDLK